MTTHQINDFNWVRKNETLHRLADLMPALAFVETMGLHLGETCGEELGAMQGFEDPGPKH